MTICEIWQFIKDYPFTIAIPVAIVGAIFGYKSYKINKIRLGLDKYKILVEFNSGLEHLKKFHSQIDKLIVKNPKSINIPNITNDLTTLQFLIKEIDKLEDKFKNAYVLPTSIFQIKEKMEELRDTILSIMETQHIDMNEYHKLKSNYGFVYFTAFLMSPSLYPKQYKPDEIIKELDHKRFMDYYGELIFK